MMKDDAPLLQCEQLAKLYGTSRVCGPVNLSIKSGEFIALVGASGSGKSTLLKMINRLIEPSRGSVLMAGEDIAELDAPLLRRNIGYVIQGIGLFDHMSVAENIAIVPRLGGTPLPEDRISQLLELVELEVGMAQRFPDALSGGQKQRVGVARALAGNPHLLLMDEPFGALDPITRDALGNRIKSLHEELALTTIMVTHDMAEALLLASRVLVMKKGVIIADETPEALLGGAGGDIAQALVAVPRSQAEKLAQKSPQEPAGSAP